jgi:hypothetical protein
VENHSGYTRPRPQVVVISVLFIPTFVATPLLLHSWGAPWWWTPIALTALAVIGNVAWENPFRRG